MRFLLDANILVTLFDNKNDNHAKVAQWFLQHIQSSNNVWLSGAITQMACLRILSLPSYPADYSFKEVQEIFVEAIKHTKHEFIATNLDVVQSNIIDWRHLQGHRQLTDAYLLALAVHANAKLVTLDSRINFRCVKNAQVSDLIIVN